MSVAQDRMHVAVVDLRDPSAPRIASQRELPIAGAALYRYGYPNIRH